MNLIDDITDINKISYNIRGAIFEVHKELGCGLLESVYRDAMIVELKNRGLNVEKEVPIKVVYKGVELPSSFRMDLLVEEKVIVELKSVENLTEVHYKQLLNYIKLSNKKLGILVNFNTDNIINNIKRIIN